MATIHCEEQFENLHLRKRGKVFSDIEFQRCTCGTCSLLMTWDPALRPIVQNVKLLGCSAVDCSVNGAIIENVLVDGCDTHGDLLQVFASAFNRVVLRGKIGRVMISSLANILGDKPEIQQIFDDANTAYYKKVKWAIDISEASFKEFEVEGIPARLIRRDKESQIVVTREKALQGRWRKLTFKQELWPTSLSLFLDGTDEDIVLVAPKASRKYTEHLADLKMLQAEGIAEPD